jgi:hypothetical protein
VIVELGRLTTAMGRGARIRGFPSQNNALIAKLRRRAQTPSFTLFAAQRTNAALRKAGTVKAGELSCRMQN